MPGSNGLGAEGFSAITRIPVKDNDAKKGITIGGAESEELDKDMLMICCRDEDKDDIIKIISDKAGIEGEGRIFVSPVDEAYTISSKTKGL